MEAFEFYFDGRPDGKDMTAGIRKMSGDPVDIALCLATYASESIRRGNPQAAIIVINAYQKFRELNPDMRDKEEGQLLFKDGARIIQTPGQDFKS